MSKYGFNTKAIHAGNTGFKPDAISVPTCQSIAYPYATYLGAARSIVTHPASTTHSAMGEAEMRKAGISPSLIRFSIGIENENDLVNDLAQAFEMIDQKVKVKDDIDADKFPQAYLLYKTNLD